MSLVGTRPPTVDEWDTEIENGFKKSLGNDEGNVYWDFAIPWGKNQLIGCYENFRLEEFVYEFYLTSKATSYYKFSIFLLYFDTKLYPVGLSIEQSIADEIGCETEIKIPDEEAFRNILASILASNTVTNVIKNLLAF